MTYVSNSRGKGPKLVLFLHFLNAPPFQTSTTPKSIGPPSGSKQA